MKIYAYYLEDGRISSVKSCEGVKLTDQEIVDKIENYNKEIGREAYKLFDIPNGMEEVITFFLGEKGYKRYSDITDVEESINELDSTVKEANNLFYDIQSDVGYLKETIEELKAKLQKKDGE